MTLYISIGETWLDTDLKLEDLSETVKYWASKWSNIKLYNGFLICSTPKDHRIYIYDTKRKAIYHCFNSNTFGGAKDYVDAVIRDASKIMTVDLEL